MSAVTPSTSTTPKKMTATPKTAPSHPKYSQMVATAITALKERGGSSRAAILKFIMANNKVGTDASKVNVHLKMALKAGVKNGTLKQTKGTGASGSFKLGEKKVEKAKKPTETAAKKTTKPKKITTVRKEKTAKPKKAAKETRPKKTTGEKKTKSPKKSKSPKNLKAAIPKKAVGEKKVKAAKKATKSPKKSKAVAKANKTKAETK